MAEKYGIPLSTLLLWSKRADKVCEETCAAFDAAMFLEPGTASRAWEAYQADKREEKAREERTARIIKLGNDCFFYSLPESLVELCERARALNVSLHILWDAEEDKHILRVRETTQHKAAGRGGKGRTAPNAENKMYLFKGYTFSGSLKSHILTTFPESAAAKRIREYANKAKSGLSAWVACQADKDIAHHYTRR